MEKKVLKRKGKKVKIRNKLSVQIKNATEGITLVALVVTVVILIILATLSISVTFGEGGLIAKAKQAKQDTESATTEEQEELDQVDKEIANIINGGSNVPTTEKPYVDSTLPGAPKVTKGLTPVKHNEETNKWEKTTVSDNEWYDYANKKWANAVLRRSNI